ncbi:RDD family protein [Actinotalea fermentans]|uniref:RDD family protein n=1 Tax=Actinotalea fermentans TaxID=43671 RepID=A0A511YSX7_9CELL|nr:RDD family protein [Actinotalea fermentans]KGM16987.1 hypothetical protein N867_12290 [Actinotalea fermentans ATCC 43279 = JCM 9966 = DSM 3133]GEN78298.1 RDD family protein [Actinotalea fermentans]
MQDEILLGEGVAIDARPASFAVRMLGALLDVVIIYAVLFALSIIATTVGIGVDPAAAQAILLSVTVLALVGIPVTVETLTRGRSVGKLATGVRIVRDDGGPVRFRHAFVRGLVGVFEIWLTFGCVALIASMVHPKGKRLGDMLAGTYAVRVRGGQRALPPIVMPHELAAWARAADIRRLPDGLALSARQLLGRASTLNPESRVSLGLQIAGEMEQYVAPGPPLGTHPERFIAAVLAERRDREFRLRVAEAAQARQEAALVHRLPYAVPDPVD